MALFKRIHEVALLLLNLFKLSSQKKPKITNTLKVGTSNGSRLGCHVMWVYLVFFFYLILALIAFCPTMFSPIHILL